MTTRLQACTVCHQQYRRPVCTSHSSEQNQGAVVHTASPAYSSYYDHCATNSLKCETYRACIYQALLRVECIIFSYSPIAKMNIVVWWLSLLLHIWEVLGLRPAILNEIFHGFLSFTRQMLGYYLK
jgi:hypothetical protein